MVTRVSSFNPSRRRESWPIAKGRILGLPFDTPGYIVLLDSLVGASSVDSEVIASADVAPRRGGEPWGADAGGAACAS